MFPRVPRPSALTPRASLKRSIQPSRRPCRRRPFGHLASSPRHTGAALALPTTGSAHAKREKTSKWPTHSNNGITARRLECSAARARKALQARSTSFCRRSVLSSSERPPPIGRAKARRCESGSGAAKPTRRRCEESEAAKLGRRRCEESEAAKLGRCWREESCADPRRRDGRPRRCMGVAAASAAAASARRTSVPEPPGRAAHSTSGPNQRPSSRIPICRRFVPMQQHT